MWRKRRNFLADLARSQEDICVTIFYLLNSRLYFSTYLRLFLKSYTTAKLQKVNKIKKTSWPLHALRAYVFFRYEIVSVYKTMILVNQVQNQVY